MNRRHMSIKDMFMEAVCWDKKLENAFKKIYTGDKVQIGRICDTIYSVLNDVMKIGYLSFETFRKVELLEKVYNKEDCVVISENSEIVTVLNKDKGTFDQFYLLDFICWVLGIMAGDKFFSIEMKGHCDFDGMMQVLSKISYRDMAPRVDLSVAENVVSYGSEFFYIVDKKADNSLSLLKMKKKPEFSDVPEELMKLSSSHIFQDRQSGAIYVNHISGNIRKVNLSTGKTTRIIPGKIIAYSNNRELIICRKNEILICTDEPEERILAKIGEIDNTLFNTQENEGVSWVTWQNGEVLFKWYRGNEIVDAHSLKADIVWHHILKNAYRFKKFDPDQKISTMLWKNKIYQTPVPFNAQTIISHLRLIEEGITNGLTKKRETYADILFPVLTEADLTKDITDDLFNVYGMVNFQLDLIETEASALAPGKLISLKKYHQLESKRTERKSADDARKMDTETVDSTSLMVEIETTIDEAIKEMEKKEEKKQRKKKQGKKAAKDRLKDSKNAQAANSGSSEHSFQNKLMTDSALN